MLCSEAEQLTWNRYPPSEFSGKAYCQPLDVCFLGAYWKAVAEPWKMLGFLVSGGEEFNLEPMMRLGHLQFLCDKVLLKYKRDRQSVWHRHQKRAERVLPWLSLAICYIPTSRLLIRERKCLKTQRVAPGPSPTKCIFEIILAQDESSWAMKQSTWILKKGRFPSKYT